MRHTEELLDQAVRVATRLGYRVQLDWLEGCGGGKCTAAGDEWIFLRASSAPQWPSSIARGFFETGLNTN